MSENTLADLGLNLEGAEQANSVATAPTVDAVEGTSVEGTTEAKKRAPRVTVNIGTPEADVEEGLEPIVRNGNPNFGVRESKYTFDTIPAPVANPETGKYAYGVLKYPAPEGQDVEALDKAVKAAVSAQNQKEVKAAQAEGRDLATTAKYYVTRALIVDGKSVGTKVLRIDNTLGQFNEATPAA